MSVERRKTMAPENATPEAGDTDIAKAFQEIARYTVDPLLHTGLPELTRLGHRGEQAASAMENQLTALEQKIDALLASAECPGASAGSSGAGAPQTDGNHNTTGNR